MRVAREAITACSSNLKSNYGNCNQEETTTCRILASNHLSWTFLLVTQALEMNGLWYASFGSKLVSSQPFIQTISSAAGKVDGLLQLITQSSSVDKPLSYRHLPQPGIWHDSLRVTYPVYVKCLSLQNHPTKEPSNNIFQVFEWNEQHFVSP